MKIELLKTVLLVFLVSLSLLLTLGIWNYQGDYETSSRNQAADAQLNGSELTRTDLVQPSQIIIQDRDSLLGFTEKETELSVFKDITAWSLYDFEMIPEGEEFNKEETEKMIEIIFPTSVPSSQISEIFSTDDSMIIDSKFKKVYLVVDENVTNFQIVFDNIEQGGIDIRANVQNMMEVVEYFDRLHLVHDFSTYVEVELNTKMVYIPKEPNIMGRKFRYEAINPDSINFQEIFFSNPSNIASSPNFEGGQVYSDGNREVVEKGYAMEYTNFTTSENQQDQDSTQQTGNVNIADFLLTNSIEYINSHNGWLVDQEIKYRLYSLSEISNRIEYRMIYNNYPVFSNQGLASMTVEYRNQNEYQYARPLMQLTFSYDRSPTLLMTGEELIAYLQQSDEIPFNQILDIQLGYRIEQGGQVFDLIPTWVIETPTEWKYVTGDATPVGQGGNRNAMGAN
ncbi:YycH family regulatory protein [Gracilibacillus kekensis]|uniref:Two-component signal transduction system YycFG, regulatory protein YycH n=1 Tax=Gracilibacillus kekensis TaxID=1027249 RepID=A0A1M7QPW5_9BACI|nr:two-component system activity regulator YycH [Gracilibacillus kekensis]SHN33589.1 Two-component signal transduction system YycFG, regulatory protein YycH [Gracilibacillus kekensis]